MTVPEPVAAARGRYSTVAIVLHWTLAALILLQVILAGRMEGRTPEAFAVVQFHKSIGITVLLLSLARLGWRLANRPPPLPADMPRWERVLAQITHIGFYAVMIGMPLTGWIMVSASKIQIPTLLFGVVPWPHIPGIVDSTGATRHLWHEIGHDGHHLIIKGFYVLIALHVAGALKHQFISRDAVLAHMAPGARPGRWLEPRLLAIVLALVAVVAFGRLFQPPRSVAAPAPALSAPEPEAEPAVAAPAVTTASVAPAATAAASAQAAPAEPGAPAAPVAWHVAKGSDLAFETTWGDQKIQGRFSRWTADILFSPEALDRSKVTVSIDMTSATTGDAQRDSSLASDEWFDAPAHPKAVFTATAFEKVSDQSYVARGQLELRGVKKLLALPFRLQIDGDRARVRGVTSLDRIAFGVGQGEWASTDQIPAKVTVRVDLKATR